MSTSQNPTTDDPNVTKEITIGGIIYVLKGKVDFTLTPKEGQNPPVVDPEVPPKPDTPRDFGTIKQGGKWTKNPGPADTWQLKNMDNPNTEFKFVSATDGKNIIANIKSKDEAIAIQNYFKVNVFPPKDPDSTTDEPDTPQPPQPEPDKAPTDIDSPAPIKGQVYKSTQRGPTVRHYKSGADDDWTIEKNVEKIHSGNHIFITDVTVNKEMEHDDYLTHKIGGNHMKNGWFDNGISIYDGQTCGGTEVKHPKTKKCLVKGKKYGDLRGKRVKTASTFHKAENKTQLWVNIPGVTSGWDLALEAANIGGFNSETKEGEYATQLRIDGFPGKDNPPEIHSAIVGEI